MNRMQRNMPGSSVGGFPVDAVITGFLRNLLKMQVIQMTALSHVRWRTSMRLCRKEAAAASSGACFHPTCTPLVLKLTACH